MKPLRVAIAGLGTVGAGTVQLLHENREVIALRAGRPIHVVAVSARDKNKKRACKLENMNWVDDPCELSELPDIDVVVELIGGADGVAKGVCEQALQNNKHVVTANKALLAKHGVALAQAAEIRKKQLMFEAAVAGGVPIIKALREGMTGNKITKVRGILNGTCNYVLTRMQESKLDFAVALKEAQELGYAEANPSTDIDGHDTAHKLAMLTALAFGVQPTLCGVKTDGIRYITSADIQYAAELKYRIKLLGVAQMMAQGLEQRVGACLVPIDSTLAGVQGAFNAVQIEGDAVGSVTLSGAGAGAAPTASAVVADLIDIARCSSVRAFGIPADQLQMPKIAKTDECIGRWYIRLAVQDQPGVVSEISRLLQEEAVSVDSLLQYGRSGTDSVPVVLITREAKEASLQRVMERIKKLPAVKETPCCLRIEK